jgi:very-short-patch-repair endonuclease
MKPHIAITIEELKSIEARSKRDRLEDLFIKYFQELKPEGVPLPERQYKILPDRKFRWDFAWPDDTVRLAIEIQGGSYMGGKHNTAKGQAADYEKHNLATLAGYRILYFNTEMLKDPASCAETVIDMIARIGEEGRHVS